jgi:hypothetical protein
MRFFSIFAFFFGVPFVLAADIYVSPFGSDTNPGTISAPLKTIQAAQKKARTYRNTQTSDTTVYLRTGRYELAQTLAFSELDSGTGAYQVIYRNYGVEKVSISGGRLISGWTLTSEGLLKANVGSMRFRQLYVNGTKARRARSANLKILSWDENIKQITTNTPQALSDLLNNDLTKAQMEMHVQQYWYESIFHARYIAPSVYAPTVEDAQIAFVCQPGCSYRRQPNQTFYFENAKSLITQPGDFFLDSTNGTLYYKPRANETASNIQAIAPALDILIHAEGQSLPVSNLQFQGLRFEHTNWDYAT